MMNLRKRNFSCQAFSSTCWETSETALTTGEWHVKMLFYHWHDREVARRCQLVTRAYRKSMLSLCATFCVQRKRWKTILILRQTNWSVDMIMSDWDKTENNLDRGLVTTVIKIQNNMMYLDIKRYGIHGNLCNNNSYETRSFIICKNITIVIRNSEKVWKREKLCKNFITEYTT